MRVRVALTAAAMTLMAVPTMAQETLRYNYWNAYLCKTPQQLEVYTAMRKARKYDAIRHLETECFSMPKQTELVLVRQYGDMAQFIYEVLPGDYMEMWGWEIDWEEKRDG